MKQSNSKKPSAKTAAAPKSPKKAKAKTVTPPVAELDFNNKLAVGSGDAASIARQMVKALLNEEGLLILPIGSTIALTECQTRVVATQTSFSFDTFEHDESAKGKFSRRKVLKVKGKVGPGEITIVVFDAKAPRGNQEETVVLPYRVVDPAKEAEDAAATQLTLDGLEKLFKPYTAAGTLAITKSNSLLVLTALNQDTFQTVSSAVQQVQKGLKEINVLHRAFEVYVSVNLNPPAWFAAIKELFDTQFGQDCEVVCTSQNGLHVWLYSGKTDLEANITAFAGNLADDIGNRVRLESR